MKRLLAVFAVVLYLSTLVWGVPGLAWSLIAGAVVFLLAFPQYVQVDPCDTTSALDRLDGVGVSRR